MLFLVQNALSSEYIRAHASMSAQSGAHSQNVSRIIALESILSRISTQVSNNDDSLKQVLEGQNFIAKLLMRCLNSESTAGLDVEVPPSLRSVLKSSSNTLSGHAHHPHPVVDAVPDSQPSPSEEAEFLTATAIGDGEEASEENCEMTHAATCSVSAADPTLGVDNAV